MELNFSLWLQSFANPWLDAVMGAITQLGSDYFYMAALCFLYWCVEVRGTMRLFVLLALSVYVGGATKELVGRLRPFQEYPELIQARFTETAGDPAFPSGHALDSLVFWGHLTMTMRRRWLYVLAPVLVALIGFSRLYLGLHWLTDVLGGFGLGLVILGMAYAILRLLAHAPLRVEFPATLLLAVLPLLFFILFPSHSGAQSMGVLAGAIVGHLVERRYIRFPVRRVWWQQSLKVLIGLAGALALLVGLSAILVPWPATVESIPYIPGSDPPLPKWEWVDWVGEAPTLLRYALVALWGTLGAPAIFRLLFGREPENG